MLSGQAGRKTSRQPSEVVSRDSFDASRFQFSTRRLDKVLGYLQTIGFRYVHEVGRKRDAKVNPGYA